MKKIKGLLLGIVSILGIGCSFGTYRQNDVDYNIGFYIKNLEFISDYGYGYFSVNSTNDGLNFNTGSNFYFSNCFGLSNCSDSQIFGIAGIGTDSFSVLRNMRTYYGDGFFSIYTFDGTHNGTIYNLLESSNYFSTNVITPTEGSFANSINYYYTRLFLDSSNTSNSNFSNWLLSGTAFGNVVGQKYQIFRIDNPSSVIRSDGLKYDCLLLSGTDIVECSKSFISAGFVDGYSFAINQNGIVNFRSVLNGFADSYSYFIESGENQYQSGYTLDGVYIMKLNSFGVINTGNYLLAMAINGNNLDFSIYNCPNNSLNISSCLFKNGGTLVENFLNSDFYNYIFAPYYVYNGGFHGNSFHFVNYYNSDTSKLYLYRGTAFKGYLEYGFNGFSLYTLNLFQSSDNPNILNMFIDYSPDPGNGNQSTGSSSPIVFDYNSYLINDMVICYITSGEVCPFENFSFSSFENSFDVVSSYYNGFSGQLLLSNAQPYLTELCLNSDSINYPFCSQLDIYSGAYILFDYINGNLSYFILGNSFGVEIITSNSGQIFGIEDCYGSYCSNINIGDTEFIINLDDSYYSGTFLSTGYFEDFLDLNKTGFFLKCPYSYDNQNIVVGKNLLSKLGGFDLFVPINCMIAGFNAGKSFSMIDWAGFKELGPIMKFTDDYDGNHKILFTFFDVLLSVAIVVILMKLYHLFK